MAGPLVALVAAIMASGSAPLPQIAAQSETATVTDKLGDRADDPAIWHDTGNPAKSLIISTDKKAGLAIHNLAGELLSFQRLGNINNVDLRTGVMVAGRPGILVAASDRSDKARPLLRLFRLDPAIPTLLPLGTISASGGQAYGLCLHRRGGTIDAFMVHKNGVIEQISLDLTGSSPTGTVVRRFKLQSRSEGCVADDRSGQLYVAEDKVAIWRIDTNPGQPAAPQIFAPVDNIRLHKDAEGLAILPRGRSGGLLFASSQGDNSFAVFRLPGGEYLGGFRIGGGALDGTEDTDGIAVRAGDFGKDWPGGLFVAQDGRNRTAEGKKAPQNFKLVPLAAILQSLAAPTPAE